ncbi:MAG: MMPL family transporter [Planctomycetaceae bacterium]
MIFRSLGLFVARFWPVLPIAWIALLVGVTIAAPEWETIVSDGEFEYLPESAPSLVGEKVFASAFSKNFWGSSVMVVARRDGGSDPRFTIEDRKFVEQILAPRLQKLAVENGWMRPPGEPGPPLLVSAITTGSDKEIGPLLDSQDEKATLVRISLTTEFVEKRNAELINAVQRLIDPVDGELRRKALIPAGLDLFLSGPAVVGKDMREAAANSAHATELATVLLVVGLLILIYRAPILAFIPLVTVFVAVKTSLGILSILSTYGLVTLFNGSEIYVTVVMYGAGVDYCMFLMARYKEELDGGATFGEGIAGAIDKIGAALVASAGTTTVGIGMMVFAEFGKFRQAGVAMSFSLVIVLIACLTLTPSLLRMFGKWAFWPKIARERLAEPPGWISPTRFASRWFESRRLRRVWEDLAWSISRRPGTWWLATAGLMLPLAIVGVLCHDYLTYGLLDELPTTTLSVQGARAVQDHYPAGEAGPITALVADPDTLFGGKGVRQAAARRGSAAVADLTNRLWEQRDELNLADVRSMSAPHGKVRQQDKSLIEIGGALAAGQHSDYYVSDTGPDAGRITRLDIVFNDDPFSRDSIAQFDRLESTIRGLLPEALENAKVYFIGPTASIRDLKVVTNRDQIRIDLMVLAGVFAVLVALLRQIMVAGYLIFTVFFSYLVTLGMTFATFWALSPGEFAGLDWKVPMFLFTILVAVGEDYNIYLVARVDEEQRRLGGLAGVREGLARTGGIISSCGIIMAGTFCSLMFGSLTGMIQLGFALAFGVILDTFVVRPLLVPAYLVLLNNGFFGSASRWLGAYRPSGDEASVLDAAESPSHADSAPTPARR